MPHKFYQPTDVTVFRPVKIFWRQAVREWYTKHPGEILNKVSCAPLLKKVTEFSAKPETTVNGFEAFGLHPLSPNTLDYTKCLGVFHIQHQLKSKR